MPEISAPVELLEFFGDSWEKNGKIIFSRE